MDLKVYFCPKCHKRIIPPKMLANINLAGSGCITVKCGDQKCNGFVSIKNKQNSLEEPQFIRDTLNKAQPEPKQSLTKEQFIDGYCERSKLTGADKEYFLSTQDVLPCNCGEEGCDGWKMVSKVKETVE